MAIKSGGPWLLDHLPHLGGRMRYAYMRTALVKDAAGSRNAIVDMIFDCSLDIISAIFGLSEG